MISTVAAPSEKEHSRGHADAGASPLPSVRADRKQVYTRAQERDHLKPPRAALPTGPHAHKKSRNREKPG